MLLISVQSFVILKCPGNLVVLHFVSTKGNHVMRKKMREGRTKGAGKESHDQLCNTCCKA
ncbi:hypothetical protein B296_00032435 [Ensete ventricosum]|uniref:Uncharacterized protein n=1 Tax=Ensete ventricosum TaxID=4639 RepID=A0A426Y9S3_ENSVE|nr:hypothetical protein B296_00032435 [Ensete ventricosum]